MIQVSMARTGLWRQRMDESEEIKECEEEKKFNMKKKRISINRREERRKMKRRTLSESGSIAKKIRKNI
jgi:hypothetical protein